MLQAFIASTTHLLTGLAVQGTPRLSMASDASRVAGENCTARQPTDKHLASAPGGARFRNAAGAGRRGPGRPARPPSRAGDVSSATSRGQLGRTVGLQKSGPAQQRAERPGPERNLQTSAQMRRVPLVQVAEPLAALLLLQPRFFPKCRGWRCWPLTTCCWWPWTTSVGLSFVRFSPVPL